MSLTRKKPEGTCATLNQDGTVDLDTISFSAADMWMRCGKQFEFRYIKGQKKPPGLAFVEGSSHHVALEEDTKSKLEHGRQLTPSQLTEIFVDEFDHELERAYAKCEEAKQRFDWNGEDKNKVLNRGRVLQGDYAKNHSPELDPVSAEEKFTKDVDVDGVKFTIIGQSDLIIKEPRIIDFKTSSRKKSQSDADSSLQLSLYSWAKDIQDVGLIVLVKDKPHVERLNTKRNPGQHMWALKTLASVVKSVRQGSFPLTNPGAFPKPWWCSAKFCGYWKDCRGVYEQP